MKFLYPMEFKYIIMSTFLLALLSFSSCTNREPSEKSFGPDIVAFVGDDTITARQFQLDYEFGFARLKQDSSRKASYLEYMIREKLLAQEGYRLGLDQQTHVQEREQHLLEELLREALFKKEVDAHIQITDEQIKEAMNKSQVRWKLRYWMEPTLQQARHTYDVMQQRGYAGYVQQALGNNPEETAKLKDRETDYIGWLDLPAEVLNAIKELELGAVSPPVRLGDTYYLFQVTDIKTGFLSDYDYQTMAQRYREILFTRQMEADLARYIEAFITPKHIRTESRYLQQIENAFIAWKQSGDQQNNFSRAVENSADGNQYLQTLKNNLDKVLVTYDGHRFSVREIVKRFDPTSVTVGGDRQQLHQQFKQQLMHTIRNYMFVKEAIEQGLQASADVKQQLQPWRDKWVYEEMRQAYENEISVSEKQARDFFNKHKATFTTDDCPDPQYGDFADQIREQLKKKQLPSLLVKKLQQLEQRYPVRINQAVLDTIPVVDFQKSNWANLLVFDNTTHQMAIPVVDPSWGFTQTP